MIWSFVYLSPILILIFFIIKNTSYKSQKISQTWLYFVEIYYISLFFTMLITKVSNGYFFLWDGKTPYEIILTRFLAAFTIYQIWILVSRNLNVSADLDSYISAKFLLNRLITALESERKDIANNLLKTDMDQFLNNKKIMKNNEFSELLKELKDLDINDNETLIYLKLRLIDIELNIDSLSLVWHQSFLLNKFK